MTEQRLTDLAILAIEKELTSDLSLDAVVNEFATSCGQEQENCVGVI